MKGFGTDEETIIDLLCSRSNAQRQAIAEAFTKELGRDVIDDLKSELGGKFEDVIVALMLPSDEYLCKQLKKAMDGLGTDEPTLIEILCPKSNEEIHTLVKKYEESKFYRNPNCSLFNLNFFPFQCTIALSPNIYARRLAAIFVV